VSEKNPEALPAILLVDDDPTDGLLMKAALERAGDFDVTTATDGDVGEALIVSREWVCAIVDLMLPGKDGVEIIQAGRKKHPDLPIMFVSASSNEALIDAAFRAGANHRLMKPIDPEDVLARIQEYASPVKSEHAPTVVAVGACPGDLEMGCGGVLSKHRAEGHRIAIVNLAGGGDPHSDLAQGSRLAADLLDATIENLGEKTDHVVDLEGATALLENIIEMSQPGILYVPTAGSDRPSSVETHRVALAIAKAVPNVLAYQDPGANMDFRPQFFADLVPHMEHKLELVAFYDDFGLKNVSTELAKATALFWGRYADPTAVEPLEIIRRAGT
jgi:CheY-like chemotaxis protein